jgi:hypothetical protein
MVRAAVMTPQFGTPCTFYTFHQYSWRGDAYGSPVSLNEVLMMSLLHGTMVSIGDDVGMRDIPPVWDLVCPYLARGEFSGYWDSACPVATGSEQVLASAYRMPGEPGALVAVGNWAYAPAEATVTVDWARLGLDPARPTVAEALTGTALTPEAGRLRIALAARDLTLLRLR